jgi:hypothetical protein
MKIRPETEVGELRLFKQLLENRCLQLAQQLFDVAADRDQALADRDAIRAELVALQSVVREGERNGDTE